MKPGIGPAILGTLGIELSVAAAVLAGASIFVGQPIGGAAAVGLLLGAAAGGARWSAARLLEYVRAAKRWGRLEPGYPMWFDNLFVVAVLCLCPYTAPLGIAGVYLRGVNAGRAGDESEDDPAGGRRSLGGMERRSGDRGSSGAWLPPT